MTTATIPDKHTTPENTGFGSKRYRTYVLSALTLIYIMNFVDRGLLAVVGPDLVPELGISDTQFGLLTGFGFALLYTIVGIPLARYADTGHHLGATASADEAWRRRPCDGEIRKIWLIGCGLDHDGCLIADGANFTF